MEAKVLRNTSKLYKRSPVDPKEDLLTKLVGRLNRMKSLIKA